MENGAGETGIASNMLSLIERGEGNSSWTTVREIAAALDLSWRSGAERRGRRSLSVR